MLSLDLKNNNNNFAKYQQGILLKLKEVIFITINFIKKKLTGRRS